MLEIPLKYKNQTCFSNKQPPINRITCLIKYISMPRIMSFVQSIFLSVWKYSKYTAYLSFTHASKESLFNKTRSSLGFTYAHLKTTKHLFGTHVLNSKKKYINMGLVA